MTWKIAAIARHPLNRSAVLAIVIATAFVDPASSECTIDDIGTCTQMDPPAAERLLLEAIGDGRDPAALFRLGVYYWTAPEVFRDPVSALWYVQRAADMGHGPAATALEEMRAEPDPLDAHVEPNQINLLDPRSTLAGNQLTVEEVIALAYEAGFVSESQLLAAVATAVAESSLYTAARNWKPEHGYRPRTDEIAVQGPQTVWLDGRQMHSDRGLWQISSFTWTDLPDTETDSPLDSARAAFALSQDGTDFNPWDSFHAGRAQLLYDRSIDGWPPLRPLVQQFLAEVADAAVEEPPIADQHAVPENDADDESAPDDIPDLALAE